MAHDIFISYSSHDKVIADAICARLEESKIRCWIAPRDILPGTEWGEAIIDAIEGSSVLILVFSSHANDSQQIKREIERAVNRGIPIIPLRIEDVKPARSLEYFISTPHWLDALTPPLESHLEYLVDTVTHLLKRGDAPAHRPQVAPSRSLDAPKLFGQLQRFWKEPKFKIASIVLGIILLFFLLRPPAKVESAFVGSWVHQDQIGIQWKQTNARDGHFDLEFSREERGSYRVASHGDLYLTPIGDRERPVFWKQIDQSTGSSRALLTQPIWSVLAFYSNGKAASHQIAGLTWHRAQVGDDLIRWETAIDIELLHVDCSLDLFPDKSYILRVVGKDSGMLSAENGEYSVVNGTGAVHVGRYNVVDKNTISLAGIGVQMVWHRYNG